MHKVIEDSLADTIVRTAQKRFAEGHPETGDAQLVVLGALRVEVSSLRDGFCQSGTFAGSQDVGTMRRRVQVAATPALTAGGAVAILMTVLEKVLH